jgi:hypothetical protein
MLAQPDYCYFVNETNNILTFMEDCLPELLKPQIKISEVLLSTTMINALWCVNVNIAQGNERVIQRICEQYLEQIRLKRRILRDFIIMLLSKQS